MLKKSPKARFNELYNLHKNNQIGDENMDGCGYKQPEKYKISPNGRYSSNLEKYLLKVLIQVNKEQLLQIEQLN